MTSPRKLMDSLGLRPQKSLGQNFLTDPNQAEAIAAKVGAGPGDRVLEIGPGLGALTRPLLATGAHVTAVEIDAGLARYLTDQLVPEFPDRLRVVHQDFLKFDPNNWDDLARGGLLAAGNLPYVISTPALFWLIEHRHLIRSAVLMFQTELADRLTAAPGGKDYGRVTVMLNYHASVSRVMTLRPEAFHPRPKVGSTVVRIVFKDNPEPRLSNLVLFEKIVAAGFARRRKTLKNSLMSAFPEKEAAEALALANLDPGRRAETLSVEEFVHLAEAWSRIDSRSQRERAG